MRKYLAVVDQQRGFHLYDIKKKESIMNEIKIDYCAFNSEFDDMFACGGDGLLFVKTLDYSGIELKMSGEIVGFTGSKIKLVNDNNINIVDLPLVSFIAHYQNQKDFKLAYKIACLGIADQDMKALGIAALKQRQFTTARKAFSRVKDLGYIELASKYEKLSLDGTIDDVELNMELLVYNKQFVKAINYLKKENHVERAIELCIQMSRWSEAVGLVRQAKQSGQLRNPRYDLFSLLKMQAEAENHRGNWKTAVELLMSSNEQERAIQILIQHNQEEEVIANMRRLNKKQHEETLKICANYFKTKRNHQAGKEAYLKIGDKEELMKFHVALEKWDEANLLGRSDPDLRSYLLLPYAEYLAKNNQF